MRNFLSKLLYRFLLVCDRIASFFPQAQLFTARFARLHELVGISVAKAQIATSLPAILLAIGRFDQVFCVRPTPAQTELGNVLIFGKTRSGKGLGIGANLLRWPHPVVVNDIKEEHWRLSAGFREGGLRGRVFKFDPRGTGHRFDPLAGRRSEFDLQSAAETSPSISFC
jgi:Type IV secretory system Conjugative DNA transfer